MLARGSHRRARHLEPITDGPDRRRGVEADGRRPSTPIPIASSSPRWIAGGRRASGKSGRTDRTPARSSATRPAEREAGLDRHGRTAADPWSGAGVVSSGRSAGFASVSDKRLGGRCPRHCKLRSVSNRRRRLMHRLPTGSWAAARCSRGDQPDGPPPGRGHLDPTANCRGARNLTSAARARSRRQVALIVIVTADDPDRATPAIVRPPPDSALPLGPLGQIGAERQHADQLARPTMLRLPARQRCTEALSGRHLTPSSSDPGATRLRARGPCSCTPLRYGEADGHAGCRRRHRQDHHARRGRGTTRARTGGSAEEVRSRPELIWQQAPCQRHRLRATATPNR